MKKKTRVSTKRGAWIARDKAMEYACSEAKEFAAQFRSFRAAWAACKNAAWMKWYITRASVLPNEFATSRLRVDLIDRRPSAAMIARGRQTYWDGMGPAEIRRRFPNGRAPRRSR